jgi:hypothetical protein
VGVRGSFLVGASRALFGLSAALWAAVGVLMVTGLSDAGIGDASVARLMGALMLLAAALLAFLAVRVLRGHRLTDLLALAVLVGSVAVSIVDEPGVGDAAFIALTLVLLGTYTAALVSRRRARSGS